MAKTYRKKTSLGADSSHLKWFGWLSGPLLDGLAKLLVALERAGLWPEQMRTRLIAQIPEASGGRRPIGLLPALARVWERVRKPVVAAWRRTVERDYNWAAKGRSPQAAAWKQALRDEVAAARGQDSAATLVDLVKAFEMVKLELVWRQGLALHFPPPVLRLVLESFAFARLLTLGRAVADAVHTLSAILAGGNFATDALFVVLVCPCDGLVLEHPGADLCLFVDDLTIHATGEGDQQGVDMQAAVSSCIEKLEGVLELRVSRARRRWTLDPNAKTVGVASSAAAAWRPEPELRAMGICWGLIMLRPEDHAQRSAGQIEGGSWQARSV